MAVLYRTNASPGRSRKLCGVTGGKYIVVGGFSFYQRAEIKDILAYLKALVSPADSISLMRIINKPARGIGKTSVEQMEHYAREKSLTLWDAIGGTLGEKLFPARATAAIAEFKKLIEEFAGGGRARGRGQGG